LDEDDEYEELLAQAEEAEAIRNLYDMADQAYEVDNTDAGVAYAASSMPQSSAVGIKTPSIPQSPTVGLRAVSKDKEEKGPDDLVKRLQAQIMAKESGGRRYDKEGNLLTSSKGAEGEMQVMPYTARDPGFGIRPAKSGDLNDLRRVGDEYAAAMYNRYGDPKLAMIAYNMGPGATDKWLAAGADPRKLPKETQGYIRGVSLAEGGVVSIPRFSGAGPSLVDIDGNPLRSSPTVPRSTTTYPNYLLNEEYGYPNERERLLDEEYRKGKRPSSSKTLTDRPKDKAYIAAEKALEEQKLRRAAMSQPKVTPGIGSLRGASIPTLALAGAGSIIEGLSGPDQVNIPTAADVNPGDLTAAEIEAAKRPALIYPRIRGKERYTSNLPVTREQIAKETTKKATPNYMPPVMLEGADNDDAARVMAMPNVAPAPAPAATPAQENADKSYFDFMQYVRDRQAKIDKTALQDQNLALLAAGLGIMGGTSPYAFANIGQGGAQGVAQLGQLQRLRAQQGIASDKLLGTASNYAAADRFRRDQLAQQKEIKEATLTSTLQKNKADWVARELKDRYGIDSMMLGQLNFKKATGDINAKDKIRLGVIEDRMREVERQAEIKFPTSTNNMKLVGTRPAG